MQCRPPDRPRARRPARRRPSADEPGGRQRYRRRQTTPTDDGSDDIRQRAKQYWPIRRASNELTDGVMVQMVGSRRCDQKVACLTADRGATAYRVWTNCSQLTALCPTHQAALFVTHQRVITCCDWEGIRRSGIVLARLQQSNHVHLCFRPTKGRCAPRLCLTRNMASSVSIRTTSITSSHMNLIPLSLFLADRGNVPSTQFPTSELNGTVHLLVLLRFKKLLVN